MSVSSLIIFVQVLTNFFTWVIIISSILSFILPPYHAVREAFNRILNPLLDPIRRLIPPASGLDFSPMILIVAIQLLSMIVINILHNMR